jgi:hypothetical protein
VHGRGFESLIFGGQWWCSAWSCGRISDFLGVNGGVVHSREFESFTSGVYGGVVHGRGIESLNFGVNGGVVHGRGFESLTFWGQRW